MIPPKGVVAPKTSWANRGGTTPQYNAVTTGTSYNKPYNQRFSNTVSTNRTGFSGCYNCTSPHHRAAQCPYPTQPQSSYNQQTSIRNTPRSQGISAVHEDNDMVSIPREQWDEMQISLQELDYPNEYSHASQDDEGLNEPQGGGPEADTQANAPRIAAIHDSDRDCEGLSKTYEAYESVFGCEEEVQTKYL